MPVFADAPIDPANKQYDNFTAADKVIKDRWTKLDWERPASPYPAPMTYADAVVRCAGEGRRIPSMKELLSLVDETPHLEYDVTTNVARLIDQRAFSGTPAEEFWTSSLRPDGNRYMTVDFGTGRTADALPGDSRRVRCVFAEP
jgi:hypothetical protein